jgi:tRNA (cmo5U34)-methyltransferase
MAEFFDRRAASYDEHMRRSVAKFSDFYRHVADPIERTEEPIAILDLGCGTGLELAFIFEKVPNARITGVDLSQEMLAKLSEKHHDKGKQITLVRASFLDFEIGEERWDYIVSVMAMHHLAPGEKLRLYRAIHKGLKPGGLYIEGDYVVTEEEEEESLKRYAEFRRKYPEAANGAYHIDIPFCSETQLRLLSNAGFMRAETGWEGEQAAVFVAQKLRRNYAELSQKLLEFLDAQSRILHDPAHRVGVNRVLSRDG